MQLLWVFIVTVAGGFPNFSAAANKALLIGTGQYEQSRYNLTGIDLDIQSMRQFALQIGYRPENILSLSGADVTLPTIERTFETFLRKDVMDNDSILIYYSGHGVQITDTNNDEKDGRDEALTLYNLQATETSYTGVLLDDALSELLASLPSKNVMMIVDACHSGTVSRDITQSIPMASKAYGDTAFQSKSLPYLGNRQVSRAVSTGDTSVASDRSGTITLSAAQDDEQALATQKGSTFTLALTESLQIHGTNATVAQIMQTASDLINQRVDKDRIFRPNLTGDPRLITQSIRVDKGEDAQHTNWQEAIAMVSRLRPLQAQTGATHYTSNDLIKLNIDIPKNGYLNVLGVDENDAMILLYPNGFTPSNHVSPGVLTLPGDHAFEWTAQEPWGNNLLIALFSISPLNLYETSLQKNINGTNTADYALPNLSELMNLGFSNHQNVTNNTYGSIVEFQTCQHLGAC